MAGKQPKIGILCHNFIRRDAELSRPYAGLDRNYIDAVQESNGIPILLPALRAGEVVPVLDGIDGLILSGGGDVDPSLFGEEPLQGLGMVDRNRDLYEILLFREARKRRVPVLGICRGIQVINIAMGGAVYQDLYAQKVTSQQHSQERTFSHASHEILMEKDTILRTWAGCARVRVNSYHHQAVSRVGRSLKVSARAKDGIIEALEEKGGGFTLGVQFHPERLFRQDAFCRKIFRKFIEKAAEKKRRPS